MTDDEALAELTERLKGYATLDELRVVAGRWDWGPEDISRRILVAKDCGSFVTYVHFGASTTITVSLRTLQRLYFEYSKHV